MKFTILFISLFFLKIFATSQEPDKIKIKGIEYSLLNNPLEKYLSENKIIDEKLYDLGTSIDGYRNISTGNYRGYIATYEIKNSKLYLIDLVIPDPNSNFEKEISVFDKLFQDENSMNLHYTGILELPTGEFIDSDNFAYSSLFENYKLITVINDKLEKIKDVSKKEYQIFKINQFIKFRKTDEYKKRFEENMKVSREDIIPDNIWNNASESQKKILQLGIPQKGKKARKETENFLFLMGDFDFIIVDY
ncbi:hypothetical protein [Halpernia frigidisoli]|nr:hypothetical protein [Halpernia frigidisoli]